MCGLLGYKSSEPLIPFVEDLMIATSVRGLHATGVSFIKGGKIHTITDSIPAHEFVKKYSFESFRDYDGSLWMIGHCRYSTSDLEYNQPIANEHVAVVHNGVITQEPFERWKELYGYTGENKNDTSLLFNSLTLEEDVFCSWSDSSIAAIDLDVSDIKCLRFYRNHKRPLWYFLSPSEQTLVVTSTQDIVDRISTVDVAMPTNPNVYHVYTSTTNTVNKVPSLAEPKKDWQNV